jgi:hypothetical protein
LSFIELLKATQAAAQVRNADPWRIRLESVRGKIGDDGVERTSTQALFDRLDVPQSSRGAGACRRLASLMRDLGWMPVKARGLTRAGIKTKSEVTRGTSGCR